MHAPGNYYYVSQTSLIMLLFSHPRLRQNKWKVLHSVERQALWISIFYHEEEGYHTLYIKAGCQWIP